MYSVGDLYKRLKAFGSSLEDNSKPLYFVKVDVKSAFDTIPQEAVLKLISSLPSKPRYLIQRHIEVKPGENYLSAQGSRKPLIKRLALAQAPEDSPDFLSHLSSLAAHKNNTIFIETIISQLRSTPDLLALLTQHISQNLVKIGKKFYRQRAGIPQGSIVSSLLCNYFYADLEAQHLSFLSSTSSLLLRQIDDFLLVTIDRLHAKRFLQTMHDGLPAYGVQVHPDKTLANFEVEINGKKIARLVATRKFPYCGSFIDIKTLGLTKDRERRADLRM